MMRKKRILQLFSVLLFTVLTSFEAGDQHSIYLIGDSTVSNKLQKVYPETGWGMMLQSFFKANIRVDNRALNGRSTKSFRADKYQQGHTIDHWRPILDTLEAGDYVFIEFGHNDEKTDKPDIGTSLEEFKTNLIRYVNETRNKKAIPVLLTPIMRRKFINGVLTDTHGGYPDVVRGVANLLHVPLIDMHLKTQNLLNHLGDEESVSLFNHVPPGHVNYPEGKKDDTHLSQTGALVVAGLVVDGIKELSLPLTAALKR